MTKFEKTTIIISIFIAGLSAFGSRRTAYISNKISERMLQIEENRKINENKEKSLQFVNAFYDKIMFTPELYDLYIKSQNEKLTGMESYFWRFINEYEGLGNKYCQEQIYVKDIKGIKNLLGAVCNNSIIENNISKSSRNAFSKLCLDFVGEYGVGMLFNGSEDCKVLQ